MRSRETRGGRDFVKVTAERPLGVTLLAILQLIGGVLFLGVQFLILIKFNAMNDILRPAGMSLVLLSLGVMLLATLSIASGIGMWLGAKWGWWLASFYYVYGIFRGGTALYTIVTLADKLQGGSRGPEYYIAKHSVHIIVYLLLLLYLFKDEVLEFFGLDGLSKGKAVGVLIGSGLLITGAVSAAASILH